MSLYIAHPITSAAVAARVAEWAACGIRIVALYTHFPPAGAASIHRAPQRTPIGYSIGHYIALSRPMAPYRPRFRDVPADVTVSGPYIPHIPTGGASIPRVPQRTTPGYRIGNLYSPLAAHRPTRVPRRSFCGRRIGTLYIHTPTCGGAWNRAGAEEDPFRLPYRIPISLSRPNGAELTPIG